MRIKTLLTVLFIIAVGFTASAQMVPPPVPPPPPPGLPIDGGIFFLLLSGIIYGVKKLRH